jgi:hypothetical protein
VPHAEVHGPHEVQSPAGAPHGEGHFETAQGAVDRRAAVVEVEDPQSVIEGSKETVVIGSRDGDAGRRRVVPPPPVGDVEPSALSLEDGGAGEDERSEEHRAAQELEGGHVV